MAQQAEGQPPANAEVVGLVRGSIFSRASNIISARRRSPLARQITHLRISAKRNGKKKKGGKPLEPVAVVLMISARLSESGVKK